MYGNSTTVARENRSCYRMNNNNYYSHLRKCGENECDDKGITTNILQQADDSI